MAKLIPPQISYGSFPPDKIPDSKAIKELAQLLRGDFDKAVSLSAKITETERELEYADCI